MRLEFALQAVAPAAIVIAGGLRRSAQLCDGEGTIAWGGKPTPFGGQAV